ncbi:fibrinogen-like protein 1 [Drosophila takahashii]|uniref:fibrinogen-like protein 1 n=1 Tax=Drosophila takahashii TaxID=29030 RepID=UPI001CF90549|nr:fibrinogen-like protein 1 [Drosophila takahashii]
MKSVLLVIVIILLIQKECPVFGESSNKELPEEPILQNAKTECNDYCFMVFKPILDHFVELKTAANASDELKIEVNTMRDTIKDLQNQLKVTEVQIRGHLENLQHKDDQIADLRNHIKSLETSLSERSNQLSKDREAEANLPDSCPSGSPNGIYELKLRGMESFRAPCVSSPSGWTVIQRRFDGSENFDRNWSDYKNGFGNVSGEFFLGLEKVHRMTATRPHELHIKLGKVEGSTSYAHYDDFQIGSEDELYELKKLGRFSGEAGDSLNYHLNKKFTTLDRDNDEHAGNCAKNRGGWWYHLCAKSSLNGKYNGDGHDSSKDGITWGSWHDYNYTISLTFVEMMIRPKSL